MQILAIQDTIQQIMTPMVQYGFAGMSFVLLAILFWMIRRLLAAFTRNASVVESCIETNKNLIASVENLREELYRRPCLAFDTNTIEKIKEIVRHERQAEEVQT